MKKNMANIDRGIRLLLVIVIAVLFLTNQISGIAAIILGIFGVAFIFSGGTGFCPLYKIFNTSSLKKQS
ncbi:MAG: DUF2892 domain-containing protein [Ignavibacterium sp.]|nr:DUF2892 domain-containing protein [Ignavibacterium sp.]